MIKTAYINQMCNKLRKQAANELDLAERGRLSHVERSNKRVRKVEDISSRTLGTQSAKLHRVSIMNKLGF
jgi:hypothetical protein